MSSKKSSLVDQILALSNPQPASFHPDVEVLEDETAAKLCDFTYEAEAECTPVLSLKGRRVLKKRKLAEEDPRYAGKVVSRKDMEMQNRLQSQSEDSAVESSADGGDDESEEGWDVSRSSVDSDQSGQEELDEEDSDEEDEEEEVEDEYNTPDQSEAEEKEDEGGVMTLPVKSLMENIEKGKAARQQMRLLDGLLETRIKLQPLLSLSNRLPAPSVLSLFLREGGAPLQEKLDQTCKKLQELLNSLLNFQALLRPTEKEELDSDSEEVGGARGASAAPPEGGTRKRKRGECLKVSSTVERDYEAEIAEGHKKLRLHCDEVISKWSEKARLASGKVTSKAFMEVERSTLAQIEHVLKDRERLRRRTQLKRSVYRILGEEEGGGEVEGTEGQTEGERDLHLKDYNEHIFDDDDFYHQLLRELIERKTSHTETSDPVEMGRQWLELQKLRRKAKKVVDTKASKGRKIRYNVHPKLVNFMAPVEDARSFSDTSKNNLFSSLFGARHNRN